MSGTDRNAPGDIAMSGAVETPISRLQQSFLSLILVIRWLALGLLVTATVTGPKPSLTSS